MHLSELQTVYIAVLAAMSLFSFLLYGIDKSKARRGSGRISERTLLAFAVYGGAIGAFLGRRVFRHKTKKLYFSAVIALSLLLQIGVLALMFVKIGGAA